MSGRSAEARALSAGEQPESNDPPCKGIDISVPINVVTAEKSTQGCYMQCMSEAQYAEFVAAGKQKLPFTTSCKPKTCATLLFAKDEDGNPVFASKYNGVFAESVIGYCNRDRITELGAQSEQAMENGKPSFTFCCVPEDPKKRNLVGAIVGGTVGGLAVLACVGVLVWMIVAKKACFAPKVGQKTTVEVPKNASRYVVVSASQ